MEPREEGERLPKEPEATLLADARRDGVRLGVAEMLGEPEAEDNKDADERRLGV